MPALCFLVLYCQRGRGGMHADAALPSRAYVCFFTCSRFPFYYHLHTRERKTERDGRQGWLILHACMHARPKLPKTYTCILGASSAIACSIDCHRIWMGERGRWERAREMERRNLDRRERRMESARSCKVLLTLQSLSLSLSSFVSHAFFWVRVLALCVRARKKLAANTRLCSM